MKSKYVYKVVRVMKDKRMFSTSVSGKKYSLEYKLNEVTTSNPNTLGIFCFKTIADAKQYFIYGFDKKINLFLKCIPIGIINKKNDRMANSISDIGIDCFYEMIYKYYKVYSPKLLDGTILCKSIKPIEIVKE